jgi:ADP-ribose pyrophosphatase YjhB (NUDIX family)
MCGCGNESFRNPIPVVVAIIPVHLKPKKKDKFSELGYLIGKRNIPPCKGMWAMNGGFVDHMETWQQAISRELKEEVCLSRPPEEFELLEVVSATNGNMLIFCVHRGAGVNEEEILFKPNEEVSEIKFVSSPKDQELCFQTHNEVFARYFEKYWWRG